MGNTLGCVKAPKDQAGEAGNAPLSPKRKARFKRKKKGKRRTGPDPVVEEPSGGVEVAGGLDETALENFGAALLQGNGEDPVESLHQSGASYSQACPTFEPEGANQGQVVQVRERFQGRLEKACLVTEEEPLQSQAVGLLPEEGTMVIARLLDNSAEQNREKVASQMVSFQRPTSGNRRAVLVPLQKEHFEEESKEDDDDEGTVVICRAWDQPKLETPTTVLEECHGAWNSEEGNDSLLSSTCGTLWTVEKGTISELSTPSPMTDQMETPVAEKSQPLLYSPEPLVGKGGEGLPASQSKLSFSGSISSTFRCSSGYGSDSTHQQAKGSTADSNSVSLCDDSLSAASVGAEGPRWRTATKEKGGVSVGFCSPHLWGIKWVAGTESSHLKGKLGGVRGSSSHAVHTTTL